MDHASFLPTTAQTTSWATANYHSTTTASVLFPQVPAEASLFFMFLRWEVSHTWYLLLSGMSLSLELSGGIGLLCLAVQAKVCSKPK